MACKCNLFSIDAVRERTDAVFDTSNLSYEPAILIANENLIEPLLGDCYSVLCAAKEAKTLTPDQQNLIDKLEPYFAWNVYFNLISTTIRRKENRLEHRFLSDNLKEENENLAQEKNRAINLADKALARFKEFVKTNELLYPCLPAATLTLCGCDCEVKKECTDYAPFRTWNSKDNFFKNK